MSTALDVTFGRPWVLAFCLGVRDALTLDDRKVPKTEWATSASCGNQSLSRGWESWWDALLRQGATHRGFSRLSQGRDPSMILPADASLRSAAMTVVAPVEALVSEWLAREELQEPAFQVGRVAPLAEGFTAAGFQTPAGRRRAKRSLGRALPDDVVVAVVPVAGEWGQVTKFGSIVVSAAVAADARVAERWFRTELWAAKPESTG